jgi:ankyrin repeat protein
LSDITSIPVEALERKRLLAQYDVEERLSWAKARLTTREEDSAYALLGLFDLFMSPIYGEGKVHAMKRLRENIHKAEEKTERDLLKSLRFDQMSSRQTTIKDAHQETCQWLERKLEYVDWLDTTKIGQHRGLLWIKGKPGAGKSTIMKFIHRRARDLIERNDHVGAMDDQSIVVAFFFNARGSTLEKSTIGMYRSLLVQLLDRSSYLQKILRLLEFPATMLTDNYQWSVGTLQTLFRDAILSIKTPVFLFIDALDECEEEEIRNMLSFLGQLGELALSANVTFQVCLASRHYPHISIDRGIHLVLDGQEGHTHDISEYLRTELKIGYSNKAMQIRAEAQRKASGIFMWVVLVVGILNKAYDSGRIHVLQRVLHDIPSDLHDLFRGILTRDSNNTTELAFCIEWILFAKEPLSPAELYFAILAGVEPKETPEWDEEDISDDIFRRFILDSSKGLAQLTVSDNPKVQFIHGSVRDFLLKEDGMDHIHSKMEDDFVRTSHRRLARCCFDYISMGVLSHSNMEAEQKLKSKILFTSPMSRHPFLHYAIQNMGHHASAAGLNIKVENYGAVDGHVPHIRCVDQDSDDANGDDDEMSMLAFSTYRKDSVGLCFASITTRNKQVVRAFVDEPYQIEEHSVARDLSNDNRYTDFKRALSTMSGSLNKLNASLVRIRRFDRMTNDIDGRLPLTWTVEYDKDALLTAVLGFHGMVASGLKVSYNDLGNVLLLASKDGSIENVQLLLDSGADPNLQGGSLGNALRAAKNKGNEQVERLLLLYGAEHNTRGEQYYEALARGAGEKTGRDTHSCTLLRCGSPTNSEFNDYNLLYAASADEEITQPLHVHKADVSVHGGSDDSALEAAPQNDQNGVEKLLQDHGHLDAEKTSTSSTSALEAAPQTYLYQGPQLAQLPQKNGILGTMKSSTSSILHKLSHVKRLRKEWRGTPS